MTGWDSKPWLRRAVFAAGNFIAVMALFVFVVWPAQSFFAAGDAEITRQAEMLARLKAIAAREPEVERLLHEKRPGTASNEFLLGPNEGVANANLQARLKTICEAAGARLRSVQALPAKTQGPLRNLGARLQIYGSIQAIHRAVYMIEAAVPYLLVDGAALRLEPAAARRDVAAEPVIDAQIDVFAAFQSEERK